MIPLPWLSISLQVLPTGLGFSHCDSFLQPTHRAMFSLLSTGAGENLGDKLG